MYHVQQKCTERTQMIQAAKLVLTHGLCPLSVVFKSSFPDVTYTSATAKRKLLQMPLAAITLGSPASRKPEVYLLETVESLDYLVLLQQSHDALWNDREEHLPLAKRQACAMNGEVVTDPESDNCKQYLRVSSVESKEAQVVILK